MYKRKKKFCLATLAMLVLILGFVPVSGQRQWPGTLLAHAAAKPSLNVKKATLSVGGSRQLVLSGTNKKVNWSSSNKKIATVSAKGVVTAKKKGKTTITAKAGKKKYTCVVTVTGCATMIHATGTPTPDGATCKVNGKTVTVSGNGWTRKYKNYSQMGIGNYYPPYGCVITAVATAASGYGKTYTPKQLHEGAASKKYSERYALKKLGASAGLYGKAAISLRTASQILTDIGIANTPVYYFDADSAIAQITANLKAGRPVLIKANNNNHSGVKIANSHHAIVLVGIDKDGYAILFEPVGGKVNYVHGGRGKSCKMTVEDLVRYHMDPTAEAGMRSVYVTSVAGAGGYILLG